MGIYLNPKNDAFKEVISKEIYEDKTLLIDTLLSNITKPNKYVCFSRPKRFRKSTDANMLSAYFSKGCDSKYLFDGMKITQTDNYGKLFLYI